MKSLVRRRGKHFLFQSQIVSIFSMGGSVGSGVNLMVSSGEC